MPLEVWSGIAHVVASVPGPGRLDLYARKPAGTAVPLLAVEAYDAESLVAAGEVAVWEVNQAIAALLSPRTQARRLTLRAGPTGHGGHLDVVAGGDDAQVVATARDGRRVVFATSAAGFTHDLSTLVRHYLALTRAPGAARTIVLPREAQPSARAALSRPAP